MKAVQAYEEAIRAFEIRWGSGSYNDANSARGLDGFKPEHLVRPGDPPETAAQILADLDNISSLEISVQHEEWQEYYDSLRPLTVGETVFSPMAGKEGVVVEVFPSSHVVVDVGEDTDYAEENPRRVEAA